MPLKNLPACCPRHQESGLSTTWPVVTYRQVLIPFFITSFISEVNVLDLEHEQKFQNLGAWESTETCHHVCPMVIVPLWDRNEISCECNKT